MLVLVDLENSRVIDVIEDVRLTALKQYCTDVLGPEFCRSVQNFCCDMASGLISLAAARMPQAQVVLDRFHVSKQCHEHLERCCQSLVRGWNGPKMRKIRQVFRRSEHTLKANDCARLEEAFATEPDLEVLYVLKQSFKAIFDADLSVEKGAFLLRMWIEQVRELNNRHLNKYLKQLTRHFDNTISFFAHRLSSGIVEGINNKIKLIKRAAYGYRNFENFRLRVMMHFD